MTLFVIPVVNVSLSTGIEATPLDLSTDLHSRRSFRTNNDYCGIQPSRHAFAMWWSSPYYQGRKRP